MSQELRKVHNGLNLRCTYILKNDKGNKEAGLSCEEG
jgi:hypothetical protein